MHNGQQPPDSSEWDLPLPSQDTPVPPEPQQETQVEDSVSNEKPGISQTQILNPTNTTPPPSAAWDLFGTIGVYNISSQGRSHVASQTPCQDSSAYSYLQEEQILVAAIADGVGSCRYSHWGAYVAVQTVITSIKRQLSQLSQGQPLAITQLTDHQITTLFDEAFRYAQQSVESLAEQFHLLLYDLQSTLTAAIYDGSHLAFCHVGDDGIVAQGTTGNYALVTKRNKGEAANSVVTLQSGAWRANRTSSSVTGFLMCTDGVLDNFVSDDADKARVFYPFLENCLYAMRPEHPQMLSQQIAQVKERMEQIFTATRMDAPPENSGNARKLAAFLHPVTDDMTVLAVANQQYLFHAEKPCFSTEEWNAEQERRKEQRRKNLYSQQPVLRSPVKPSTPVEPEPSAQTRRRNRQTLTQGAYTPYGSTDETKPKYNPWARPAPPKQSNPSVRKPAEGVFIGIFPRKNETEHGSGEKWFSFVKRECPKCYTKYRSGSKFCSECGYPLPKEE